VAIQPPRDHLVSSLTIRDSAPPSDPPSPPRWQPAPVVLDLPENSDRAFSAAATRLAADAALRGHDRDAIALATLRSRREFLEGRKADQNGYLNDADKAELTSLEASIKWQESRPLEPVPQADGTIRGSLAAPASAEYVNYAAQSTYESDFKRAVQHEIDSHRRQGMALTAMEAATVVEQRIKAEGRAAVLPNFDRVMTRAGR
jgi:hypothetical protein